ncbi:hypothetical protein BDP27DRAFT_1413535 [Rhodocollybia butyracea]|uniref:Uncharacterized protein n=1 Tax=Rhodocollybia butyracea TaxID=206335 RepID=A0A9P5UF19_9AGAR|nr:hypothetical protein BDP27DRAFT_1413535 [Rhodocollybia butyracea]
MPSSNEYVKLPTSEHVSLPHSPTTSLGSTVGDASTEPPRPEDTDIADALALKLRKKLFSEITGLALRTFLIPVSAYALLFLIVFLMSSPLVFVENWGQKPCNCTNISNTSTPLLMSNTSHPSHPIPPPPISETKIGREKAQVFIQFFLILVFYDAVLVLLTFRNVRGFVSSKIEKGVSLLKRNIENNEYRFALDRPVGVHRYTQYSGSMRPDPRTWKPKTTFFKGNWSFLAWHLGIIDFVLVSITSIIWAAHAEGIHSGEYGLGVLSKPFYITFGLFGALGLMGAAIYGLEEFVSGNLKLETSGAVFSDKGDVVWGMCEEIWMAMAMDSVKLRKLSQTEAVGHAVSIV